MATPLPQTTPKTTARTTDARPPTDGPALNVAQRLRVNAGLWPDKPALHFPSRQRNHYAHKTFRELDAESDRWAHALAAAQIGRGTKTLLMVKPSPELFTVLFALFKLGAVPVVVDPGMGLSRMLHCYRTVGADALVGIPAAHVVRVLFPRAFASLKSWVTVGRKLGWSGATLPPPASRALPDEPFPIADTRADDLLMVNFTTGATGPAKGVEYTHSLADAMIRRIESEFAHGADDVALAPLPLFAAFHLLIGAATILPPIDPNRPARADAAAMLDTLDQFRVTHMFASPAFLRRVGDYAALHERRLPTLRRVISGGAPVLPSVARRFAGLLSPDARLHVTYGATEALPIASIASDELLGETSARSAAGEGSCVGRPLPELELRVIRASDEPITRWANALLAPAGEVGELTIAGPTVSRRYHESPEWNALLKIADGARSWHRTGDLGRVDADGRVWFAGRKSQTVHSARGPLFTAHWEGIFDAHPDVYRSALVGIGPIGAQQPVVCVELSRRRSAGDRRRIERELLALAASHPLTRGVRALLFHRGFPVDIRHNAKIDRAQLAGWAARRLAPPPRALQLIPLAGWLFILIGLVTPLPSLLRTLWAVDLFSSVVVHGLQLFVALPRGTRAGYSRLQTVAYTFLYGATWWKFLDAGPGPRT
jgi:acyl-CoA synthetase (AMP-forming)/AMP-acid ligase II/uncharacterized protein YhhL (DUF1145 family)